MLINISLRYLLVHNKSAVSRVTHTSDDHNEETESPGECVLARLRLVYGSTTGSMCICSIRYVRDEHAAMSGVSPREMMHMPHILILIAI